MMDAQALQELHSLVNAQLLHHRAVQPRLDVVSTADQIVATKRIQHRQFVLRHKLESLQLQTRGHTPKTQRRGLNDGSVSSNTSIVSTESLRLESTNPFGKSKFLVSSVLSNSNSSAADSVVGNNQSMPLPLGASESEPTIRMKNRLNPIMNSQSGKMHNQNASMNSRDDYSLQEVLSRASSPSKLHRHGQYRKLATTVNNFSSSASSVDSISTLATAPPSELIENVSKVFNQLYNQRNISDPLEKRAGEFTKKLGPKVSLGTSYDYNKSINLVNKYIEEVEDLSIKSSSGPGALLLDREFLEKMQNSYFKELKSYESIALYVQMRYIELKQHECGTVPSKTKSIVVADLAMKLSKILGRFSTVLEPLLWELFNAIFQGYAENERNFTPDNFISELAKLNTFADMYHDTHTSLEDVNEELHVIQQGHNMKRIVKKFQTVRLAFDEAGAFIRDACFKIWRRYTKGRSRLKHIGKMRGLRYRFNIWRRYNRERDKREMEEYTQELDRKIDRLSVLNTLIESHNVDQINKIVTNVTAPVVGAPGGINRMLSSVSTDDYRGNLPVNQLERIKAKNAQDRIRQQKGIVEDLNKKITKSLGTVAIVASPAVSRQASMDIGDGGIPTLRSFSTGNINIGVSNTRNSFEEPTLILEGEFSPRFDDGELPVIPETMAEDNATLQVLEQTARLTTQILADYQDEMTQTPDDWMVDVWEPVFGFLHPVEEEHSQQNIHNKPHTHEKDIKSHLPPIGERIHRKYEMNVYAAEELISLVYEAKVADLKMEKVHRDFSGAPTVTLMEYTKNFMLSRYKLRRMCTKFYKELYASCIRDYRSRPRLELFATLCGYPLEDAINPKYDSIRCDFLFNLLYTLFEGNAEAVRYAFEHRIIDREWVLDKLPLAYPTLYEFQNEQYQNLIFEVVDLHCADLSQVDFSYKVNMDELLMVLMAYWDVEVEATRKQHEDSDDDL